MDILLNVPHHHGEGTPTGAAPMRGEANSETCILPISHCRNLHALGEARQAFLQASLKSAWCESAHQNTHHQSAECSAQS